MPPPCENHASHKSKWRSNVRRDADPQVTAIARLGVHLAPNVQWPEKGPEGWGRKHCREMANKPAGLHGHMGCQCEVSTLWCTGVGQIQPYDFAGCPRIQFLLWFLHTQTRNHKVGNLEMENRKGFPLEILNLMILLPSVQTLWENQYKTRAGEIIRLRSLLIVLQTPFLSISKPRQEIVEQAKT